MIFSAFGISEAVTGYMWITMLRPDAGGLLNSVIRLFGFPDFAQPWLGDPEHRDLGAHRRRRLGRCRPAADAVLRLRAGDPAKRARGRLHGRRAPDLRSCATS